MVDLVLPRSQVWRLPLDDELETTSLPTGGTEGDVTRTVLLPQTRASTPSGRPEM
ncbi:MAG TPA: hypothetical protein VLA91_12310 [Acidimicrobiia bacterium]|nr:hypothetical protein [Acidimicrobiia bacterium]